MTLLEFIRLIIPMLRFLVLDSHHESRVYCTICKLTQQPCGSQVEAPCHLIAPTISTYPFCPVFSKSTKYLRKKVKIVRCHSQDLSFIPSTRRLLPLLSPPLSMFSGCHLDFLDQHMKYTN